MSIPYQYLYGWLSQIRGIIPPFAVEVFLTDGRGYFLRDVKYWDEKDPSVVIGFWDMRSFTEEDVRELKGSLGRCVERNECSNHTSLHAKLDVAVLRLPKESISYVACWNNKIWPMEFTPCDLNDCLLRGLLTRFDNEMYSVYEDESKVCGSASALLSMIKDLGSVGAAKILLYQPNVSEGFKKLKELGRLDLAIENIILDPRWHDLFTDQERKIASDRLHDAKFTPKY